MSPRYRTGPTENMRKSRSGFLFFLITAVAAVLLATAFTVNFLLSSSEKNKAEQSYQEAETAKETAKQQQEAKDREYNALNEEIEALQQKIAELS